VTPKEIVEQNIANTRTHMADGRLGDDEVALDDLECTLTIMENLLTIVTTTIPNL
jgi:hypothetical protein